MTERRYKIWMLLALVLMYLLQASGLKGQSVKDTVQLSEFNVTAKRSVLPESFFKWSFDSTDLATMPDQELSDFFSENSAVYLKNYGVDGISSISMRGTSAGHTKVYWNGISLNSPMLGQADASLFPVNFVDNLELHPGTGSVFEGSGGLGGNVVLSNYRSSNNKDHFQLFAGVGSFQSYTQAGRFTLNNGKWQFRTTLLNKTALNNFEYRDYHRDNRQFKRRNAASETRSAMQEAYYKMDSRNQLTARLWLVEKERDLPPILGVPENSEHQRDASVKSMVSWENRGEKSLTDVSLGLIYDNLDYTDDSLDINSESNVQSFQLVVNNQYFWKPAWKLRSQLRLTNDQVTSTGYEEAQNQNSISFLTGFTYKLNKDRWLLDVYSRQELWDEDNIYVLPAIGTNYKLGKKQNWIARLNVAANVNRPTLNDRFWINSGNENLKPERSRGVELGIANEAIQLNKHMRLKADLNLYHNQITDWIIWMPSNGRWIPENIRSVSNRGVELLLKVPVKYGKNDWNATFNYVYNESRDISGDESSNENYNHRLIYVPKNKIAGSFSWKRYNWLLWTRNTLTDRVFINSANSVYLPSFFIQDIGLKRTVKWGSTLLALQVVVENTTNSNYQIIAERPMPGRSYGLNLTLNF